jgi:hypothetical protein
MKKIDEEWFSSQARYWPVKRCEMTPEAICIDRSRHLRISNVIALPWFSPKQCYHV